MTTRERMIVSTALLVRERGARATSIDDVLAHSGAPRGSVYHHFPGGREQLLREATAVRGRLRGARLSQRGRARRGARPLRRRLSRDLSPTTSARLPGGGRRHRERVRPAGPRRRRLRSLAGRSARGPALGDDATAPLSSSPPLEGALVLCRPNATIAPLDAVHHQLNGPPRRARMTVGSPPPASSASATAASRSQLEGRTLAKIRGDRAHPALAGLHVQQGDAARPLPERPRTGCTSPLRRRADGTFEEIDWDTAIAEVAARLRRESATSTAASTIFYYGGGGQGNHLGGAYSGALLKALGAALPLQRARAGEDGRGAGSTRSSTAATPAATSSTPRSRSSSARTRGSRRASRAPASSLQARSPRTRSAR